MNLVEKKRFVVSKGMIGKEVIVQFTNKKGVKHVYNHDKAYSIMKDSLNNMNCFKKYKSYTATNNIPVVLRGVELV